LQVINIVLFTARSDVSIIIEVALQTLIDRSYQSKAPKVKFPAVDEKRIVNVLLDYEGLLLEAQARPLNEILDLPKVRTHIDTVPSV